MTDRPQARLLLAPGDLTDEEVRWVLARSEAHLARPLPAGPPFRAGLVFLSSSLRTRVGFAVAVARLGGVPVEVGGPRADEAMTRAESFSDTVRAVTGMVDVAVVRTPERLCRDEVARAAVAPLVNGGDGAEHPTQALVDLATIERERGPIGSLSVGLCGDMGSRSARSFVQLLDRFPPRQLVVMAPEGRADPGVRLGRRLEGRSVRRAPSEVDDLDVLSMVGLAEGRGDTRLDDRARAPFVLTGDRVRDLPADAVVLSPMPVIDEVAPEARADPRVRMFAQSDAAVAVRMAVLELVLGRL